MTSILGQELQKLSILEKLELMDFIWSDIARDPGTVPVLQSHQEELLKRQERIASGESTFSDWDEAKKRLFSKVAG